MAQKNNSNFGIMLAMHQSSAFKFPKMALAGLLATSAASIFTTPAKADETGVVFKLSIPLGGDDSPGILDRTRASFGAYHEMGDRAEDDTTMRFDFGTSFNVGAAWSAFRGETVVTQTDTVNLNGFTFQDTREESVSPFGVMTFSGGVTLSQDAWDGALGSDRLDTRIGFAFNALHDNEHGSGFTIDAGVNEMTIPVFTTGDYAAAFGLYTGMTPDQAALHLGLPGGGATQPPCTGPTCGSGSGTQPPQPTPPVTTPPPVATTPPVNTPAPAGNNVGVGNPSGGTTSTCAQVPCGPTTPVTPTPPQEDGKDYTWAYLTGGVIVVAAAACALTDCLERPEAAAPIDEDVNRIGIRGDKATTEIYDVRDGAVLATARSEAEGRLLIAWHQAIDGQDGRLDGQFATRVTFEALSSDLSELLGRSVQGQGAPRTSALSALAVR